MSNENEEKNTVAERQDMLVLNFEGEGQGALSISQNTIARIVMKTALGVEGVARFAPKGAGDLLGFFTGKAYDSSLVIEFQDGVVNLNLALNLYFGAVIPQVIKEVRSQVVEQVTLMTGAKVGRVDILVKDLLEPEEVAAEEPPEADAENAPAGE